MKSKLSLQEKLRDLRDENKLTLAELEKAVGIPASTLQRIESDEDMRVGYQDTGQEHLLLKKQLSKEVLVTSGFHHFSADTLIFD